jgi:hypothetical protein
MRNQYIEHRSSSKVRQLPASDPLPYFVAVSPLMQINLRQQHVYTN